jgi:hypothetical protein
VAGELGRRGSGGTRAPRTRPRTPGVWDPPPPPPQILGVGKVDLWRGPSDICGEVVVDNPHVPAAKDRRPEPLANATRSHGPRAGT